MNPHNIWLCTPKGPNFPSSYNQLQLKGWNFKNQQAQFQGTLLGERKPVS